MEIIKLNGIKIAPNTVAAIGFFDGVHLAHKTLIETMKNHAKEHALKTAIITFDIHPKSVLFDLDYTYITPIERKIEKIATLGVDYLYLIEFSKDKAKLSPEAFIDTYLNGLHTLVCGFDFKFGVRASGTVETLKNHKEFNTIVVGELTYEGYKIGSTHIRDLILSGQVNHVLETLGDYYSVRGEVIHGEKKGRAIGYPTANIDTGDYLIPKKGVYATKTKVNDIWYPSMSSIGHNPTLNCKTDLSVESYLFDFDRQIYGEIIEIKFIKRLRDEIKFNSVEALIDQIKQDEIETLNILKNIE
ncbi:bifunctional riboflavin kinase/FAD synthetase [Liberiplasma polymorphum]|jgi:riboflavin kinase / FMN adenylyltransferase|uniref:bifunctional riboflavin kinase/FAD synthetase n=1 Tax=Liberiplasma polymorphum TaxID=3374570 RepID=UPI003773E1B3